MFTFRFLNYGLACQGTKQFSSTASLNQKKVSVIGAAGGIGQPLSLLLKILPTLADSGGTLNAPHNVNPLLTSSKLSSVQSASTKSLSKTLAHLALYDVLNTKGIAADLSHIPTPTQVSGFDASQTPQDKRDNLISAITGSDIVVIPAGIARKPGMTRQDLFDTNATIVKDIAVLVAKHAPQACLCIITNPVNSTVPIASEVLKHYGVYDPRKVIGVTTLDIVRSNTFTGQLKNLAPQNLSIPVIGGHSGNTIVPVLSQATPIPIELKDSKELSAFVERVQNAGTEVVKAKAGGGSATLSMAYAGARFVISLLEALDGRDGVIECGYVLADKEINAPTKYFANPLLLGRSGVAKNLGFGKLTAYEEDLVRKAVPELKANIEEGEKFVAKVAHELK